jgi:hypothetical protein
MANTRIVDVITMKFGFKPYRQVAMVCAIFVILDV